ncbi:MAG: methylmalonyl-CoA decarboxylase subunit alpha, partial [Acidimicrobiaceae bacterium]|nr:methylmalonyl-CoA decarboxylase subunit alpha [Acidimicrobiaceae bacterium]
IDIGETGGARIPDILGAVGISGAQMSPEKGNRNHRVPSATVIVGKSFGGSSISSARGDFTVQVRGSCLAITSPRVFEVAIGEKIGFEELGGVDIHAEHTGQIDLDVDTEDDAWHALRRWLSFLPSNAWQVALRVESAPPAGRPDSLGNGDGRELARHLVDEGSWFELRPRSGRSLLTALARIDGWPVGMIVSHPALDGGLIDAHACEKAIRLLVLCDSFNLPVISLIDSAGLVPDDVANEERVLLRFSRLRQAIALATCPRILVVTGRAFGLAFASVQHAGWATDGAYAWPGASLGQPDGSDAARAAYEAAGVMGLDEIIEPAATRSMLTRHLGRLAQRRVPDPSERRLSYWSSC